MAKHDLATYLNDHLAGTSIGDTARMLRAEFEEDREAP